MENNIVTLSNQLITASYALTLSERRVVYSFLSIIDNNPEDLEEITSDKLYQINVRDYADLWGIETNNARKEIKEAIDKLYSREITITKNLPEENDTKITVTRWISSKVSYTRNQDAVALRWAHDIIPYISELRKNFTSIKIRWLKLLGSSFSMRFYDYFLMELNKSRKSHIIVVLTILEVRYLFALDDKYDKVGHLIERVIAPAIVEISEKTNLSISITDENGKKTYIKEGKKVVGIKFSVGWDASEKKLAKK